MRHSLWNPNNNNKNNIIQTHNTPQSPAGSNMTKLVKTFIVFGPVQGTIKVIKKYANHQPGQHLAVDESLMSTLCLPSVELVSQPNQPKFQTFLVTKEDGQVLYGSGLIVQDKYPGGYANYCYTIITDIPFINATRSLLHLVWEKRSDDKILRAIMNIPLPARRRCLRIITPPITLNPNLVSGGGGGGGSSSPKIKGTHNHNHHPRHMMKLGQNYLETAIDDIYLYRGMADLPLLDYPLRELFTFLHVDDFLLAFACLLMEFKTLIISEDNYKLMMVGETLTSLLLPLKWCNVYVPILPPVYGATYLDAPTSYIMGINTQVTNLPDNIQHIQCRIYCDDNRVVCDADSLALPLFLNDLKRDIMRIKSDYEKTHQATPHKPITYLDDLKFNRAIRILFMQTIREHILANYERYIVDVPEASSEIRQFDVVSYLSDQPEFMHGFLSKFLETQLFASFIDENAKRMQQSWISIFDMDPEELSERFSDKAIELAFANAQRIHLMDLRETQVNTVEVKTVPASPMKLRRRVPALASSLANRFSFAKSKSSNSTSIDVDSAPSPTAASLMSSPPIHRNSVAVIPLQGHISLDPSLHLATTNINNNEPSAQAASTRQQQVSTTNNNNNNNQANGKIHELINEVRDLTKGILIDQMGSLDDESVAPVGESVVDGFTPVVKAPFPRGLEGMKLNTKTMGHNRLIGSLCDLIERVWSHGVYSSPQDISVCCPLWNHLIAFTRLKYLDFKPKRQEFADGSHLNILSPAMVHDTPTELDMMVLQNSNPFRSFNWFKLRKSDKLLPHVRDLINDLRTIHTLKDVKTDIGRARAFIRLSLERKRLSKHLRTLLGDQTLVNSLYKPYAFLRCDEEREQFLMYLLTLNAVDLPCFSTTFISVINTRRIKLTTTTSTP